MGYYVRQKTPNARQGITTACHNLTLWQDGMRQKTPNARQGITTLGRQFENNRQRWSENPQCPTGHYD